MERGPSGSCLYPVVTALQPGLDDDAPIPFLWLVPASVFPLVEAGSLTYPKLRQAPSVLAAAQAASMTMTAARAAAPTALAEELASADRDWQALNAATSAAKALGSRVVQYAVCIPEASAQKPS